MLEQELFREEKKRGEEKGTGYITLASSGSAR
jgi:hypothetical protein